MAKILKVYDGDTFTFEVDLGFSIKVKERLRLARVDTPEVRGNEKIKGKFVRDHVRELILGQDVEIHVMKKGKYGRYIAEVYFKMEGQQYNLSDFLIAKGYAEEVEY